MFKLHYSMIASVASPFHSSNPPNRQARQKTSQENDSTFSPLIDKEDSPTTKLWLQPYWLNRRSISADRAARGTTPS
jgi:hypothetical protein